MPDLPRRTGGAAAAFVAGCLVVLLTAAPATAGFTPAGTFGGAADLSSSGVSGRLAYPAKADAAADGTLYVVDRDNQRIAKFDPNGVWVRAWGKAVDSATPGSAFETCTSGCAAGQQGG